MTSPTLKVGTLTELFNLRHYVAPSGSPRPQFDVTRDGQRFLMPTGTGASDSTGRIRIVVVQNWHEELKRLVPIP